ncbi:MAG TPA: hypothetical protein VGM77_00995 [Gemmatimonadales bacterium]|jgi:hypothetical protein
MTPAVRRIVAVLVACIAAFVVVNLLEHLAQQVSMPPGLDPTNATQVEQALERGEFPFASLALVVAGWLLAAYVGSRIAMRIDRSRVAPLIFTVLFTVKNIHYLSLFPHPTWMWIAAVLAVPLVAMGAAGESITVRGI